VHTEHVRWRTCTQCGVLHLESESESERKNQCGQKWELVGVCVCVLLCVGVKQDAYSTKKQLKFCSVKGECLRF
jgi:hypothetical protein